MAGFQFSVSTECISRQICDINVEADDLESAKQKMLSVKGNYHQKDISYDDDTEIYEEEYEHFQNHLQDNPFNHSKIIRYGRDIIHEEGTPTSETSDNSTTTQLINNNKRRLL